ncbi:MAG: sigma-70 family RNA polymerase sigma factor [Burkholderiales bacterium]|nr:sigma-70 family RNA polymerase sigma factor [Phycisphaerae bacterium]
MIQTNSVISDADLLLDYARTRLDPPFRELVGRHIDLVYTAALRQVRDPHLADDVAQAVFLILSKRAASLRWQGSVAGWLLVTTRHVARNALKHEIRLKRREQKVAAMSHENQPPLTPEDESINAVLDQAMSSLNDTDRDVIIQRFFNAKSHREVGEALGVSEEAASKRVARALEKLRAVLTNSGINTSAAALSAVLPIIAVKPAPPALAAAISGNFTATTSFVAAIAKPVLGGKTVTGALIAWGSAAVLAVAVTAGVVVMQNTNPAPPAPPPQAAAPVKPATDPTTLTISVIDTQTKTPVPGAEVQLQRNGNGRAWVPVDAQGHVQLPMPGPRESMTIFARAPGRVPATIQFNNSPIRGDRPSELAFPLDKGQVIGGIVVDEKGEPVPEAIVRLTNFSSGNRSGEPQPQLSGIQITTDTEGRWTYESAPLELSRVGIAVTHPSVVSEESYSSQYPAEELKNETAKIPLVKSKVQVHTRTGVVLDPDGKPMSGVTVTWAFNHQQNDKPTAKTDSDGRFSITSKYNYHAGIAVQIPGYAPAQVEAQKVTEGNPVTLRLTRPVALEGIVVDENNAPVRGATVGLSQWRDMQLINWKGKTDSAGKFTWAEAPNDEVEITIAAPKKMPMTVVMKPGGAPSPVTLYPSMEIVGKVIDVDTREPVQEFTMTYGTRNRGSDNVSWQSYYTRTIANGKYEATMDSFGSGGKLRVEAKGYLPVVSRMIEPKESVAGKVTIDFELKKGSGPSGTVVDADGKPVGDVSVVAIPKNSGYSVSIDTPTRDIANIAGAATVKTDAQGRFIFNPLEGQYSVITSCDAGLAVSDLPLSADQTIKLQKWGTIDGVWKQNAGVAAGVNVVISVGRFGGDGAGFYVQTDRRTRTDAQGRFTINRVPPGVVQVSREVPIATGTAFISLQSVEVASGQTLTLDIGGKGRPVIGKIVLPPELASKVALGGNNLFAFYAQSMTTSAFNPFDVVEFPADYADMTTQARAKWNQEFMQKPKMAAMFKAMQDRGNSSQVQFTLASDGTFRADDVLPGRYRVTVELREPWVPGRRTLPDLLAKIDKTFDVPATPAVPTDIPVDIGTLTPGSQAPVAELKIGSALPAVPLVTLDGKPLDLAEFRGKVLLIHTWHLDGQQMSDAAKQIEDEYAGNEQVIVLHVGIQTLKDWAARIAEKKAWRGISAIGAAEYAKQYDPAAWNAWRCNYSAPECLLVDRDGKLVARISKPDDLKKAVADLMSKP